MLLQAQGDIYYFPDLFIDDKWSSFTRLTQIIIILCHYPIIYSFCFDSLLTYSIILLLSHFLLLSFQCRPSWWEKKRHRHNEWPSLSHTQQTQRHTHTHTKKNLSEISPSVSGEFESRAVWSHQGQTVARHPEELPLCLCAATSCNLLLRDKTKLTRHFTADLTILSGPVRQIWLKLLWGLKEFTKQINGHYPSWWYSTSTAHWHKQLSTFTQVLMCNLSPVLPCGIAGYFPTLTTYE